MTSLHKKGTKSNKSNAEGEGYGKTRVGYRPWAVDLVGLIRQADLDRRFQCGNIFDTVDDPDNPRDDTYLPLSVKKQKGKDHDEVCEQYNKPGFYREQCKTLNWDDQTYGMKLQRYAEVLKAMPQMPDVLVIPETENKRVLEDLTTRGRTIRRIRARAEEGELVCVPDGEHRM